MHIASYNHKRPDIYLKTRPSYRLKDKQSRINCKSTVQTIPLPTHKPSESLNIGIKFRHRSW